MSVHEYTATTIDGREQSLAAYRGKVLLIVNTASKCGFTPQYQELQSVYEAYRDRGFEVLGFPCNQFGEQEPAGEQEIKSFCDINYGVTFPLYAKIEVNGKGTHPLFQYLKESGRGVLGSKSIKWNFTKFLVDRDGNVIERYAPSTSPASITKDIEKALS